ncbi:MAG: hypothetical protein JXR66_05820 [Bacteroidales bacterium]|nr:hypothetical protein [Bacteroidales bacterium]
MKKILTVSILMVFSAVFLCGQTKPVKKDPSGNWKFEAPYAPEGYTTGTMNFAYADKKYSTAIMFPGSDYKFAGEKVKFANDTVSFVVYIEGDVIAISLKMDDNAKMTGKAISSQGEIPLSLSRQPESK